MSLANAMHAETGFAASDRIERGAVRFALGCLLAYITIYSLESPIRYALYLAHADPLILARDLLIDLPVVALFFSQLAARKLHGAFVVFAITVGFGIFVFMLNFGALQPVVIGIKLLMNVLLGLLMGGHLLNPSRRVRWLFAFLLAMVAASVIAEKYFFEFPWVGVHTTIAGADVEISRDWQTGAGETKRIGGFTHESISAATLMPILGLIVATPIRRAVWRGAILLAVAFAVFLTTQKGSILGLVFVAGGLCLPPRASRRALPLLVLLGLLATTSLPLLTNGWFLQEGSGDAFTITSFVERINTTWPLALGWIADHSLVPFGVGVGGMGVPLKTVAPGIWQYPDNLAIFVYADFGIVALLFFGWIAYAAMRSYRAAIDVRAALSVLAFLLLYGVVISIVEDQMASLFLGSSIGALLNAPVGPAIDPGPIGA